VQNKVRARFFKDGAFNMVEISIIGDPNTIIRKVRPEDTQRFSADWNAFESGQGEIDPGGTPLTDVPGIDRSLALAFKLKGIRNAEELAALDEAAARALGMGGVTTWQTAKLLMQARQAEQIQTAVRRGRPPKAQIEAAEIP
jgi:hypothetical protein